LDVVEDAPPIDKRAIIPILLTLHTAKWIKEKSGITFLTIPKGLSILKLKKITRISPIYNFELRLEKEVLVEKTYRIAITNSGILVEGYFFTTPLSGVGARVPSLLSAATLFSISSRDYPRESNPNCLYKYKPYFCEDLDLYISSSRIPPLLYIYDKYPLQFKIVDLPAQWTLEELIAPGFIQKIKKRDDEIKKRDDQIKNRANHSETCSMSYHF
jgi:hypothetical protein